MTPGARLTDRIAAVAGLATVGAMIATPLLPQQGTARKVLSSVVVGGFLVSARANAARRWGGGRARAAAGTIAAATAAVERFGTQTGIPFGRYAYTQALRPQVAHVPAIVPLAWFAMALPARETAHAVLGRSSSPATRVVLGSAALTAWDLFLDPQMVGEGYWAWARVGRYRGIPFSNFAGWFVTGLAVMAALDAFLPPARIGAVSDTTPAGAADGRLVGTYSFMAVMETLGFARFFRDPLVATVGGAGMLPLAATAVARTLRS